MKRFLSLFAVVALVVSMFSGVVFANSDLTFHVVGPDGANLAGAQVDVNGTQQVTDADGKTTFTVADNTVCDYEITKPNYVAVEGTHTVGVGTNENLPTIMLDQYTVDFENGTLKYVENGFVPFRGRILYKSSGGLATNAEGKITVNGQDIEVKNGLFDTVLVTGPGEAPKFGVGAYVFGGAGQNLNDGGMVEGKTFYVVNDFVLEQPAKLEYVYPVTGSQTVSGVYPNKDGLGNTKLEYADGTAIVVDSSYDEADAFGLFYNGAKFTKVGDFYLYFGTARALKGTVKAGALDVTLDRLSLPHSLGNQNVKFTFNLPSDYFLAGGAFDGGTYGINLNLSNADLGVNDDIAIATGGLIKTNQKVTQALNVNGYAPGVYKATVTLKTAVTAVLEKTFDVQIVDPSTYTLTKMNKKTIKIGTTNYVFATDFEVTEYIGGVAKNNPFLVVTYEGAGLKSKTVRSLETGAGNNDGYALAAKEGFADFDLKPTQTGTINMKIDVYDKSFADNGKLVHTFEQEIKVEGWNATIEPKEVLVDVAQDFVVTITDQAGTPINNARVTLGALTPVDARLTSISNGSYVIKNAKFTTVGKVDLVVDKWDEIANAYAEELKLQGAVNVVGASVYNVSADKEVLLNGLKEKVMVTALDSNGNLIYPVFKQVDVNAKGVETVKDLVPGARKDLDNDGVKEAVTVEIQPGADAVKTLVRVTTDNGKKKGEVELQVQKPKVVHTGATKWTGNFKTNVEFTVVDPRDDSLMTGLVVFVADPLDNTGYGVFDVAAPALVKDMNHVWRGHATVTVDEAEWTAQEKDGKVLATPIMMNGVELGKVEVAKPVLSAEPEKVIIGAPTNLVLTYTDADGNPIKGKMVRLGHVGPFEDVDKTDEEGKVVYSTATGTSAALRFSAVTDTAKIVLLTVKSAADLEGPVITAEVTGNTALIRIADNVRVNKVLVNNELVDMFFAMPEVTHMVNLKPGVNTFNVQAVDTNNNYSQATLELSPEAPAVGDSFSFTLNEGTDWGVPVLVNGTTMVPVRMIESLGATFAWDGATKTATFTLDGNTVVVTVGKETALVNGEEVLLPEKAYVNEQGRMMVPLRLVSQELGFTVTYVSATEPIVVSRPVA